MTASAFTSHHVVWHVANDHGNVEIIFRWTKLTRKGKGSGEKGIKNTKG